MKTVGKEDGIDFSYGGKVGNTLNSHRAIEWAKKFGKHEEVLLLVTPKMLSFCACLAAG